MPAATIGHDVVVRLVPSRRVRWILGGLAVAALVTVPLWRDAAVDLARRVFPDRAYSDAAARDSDPAPLGEALELPTVTTTAAGSSPEPAIALELLVELEGPSAVADPRGAGPLLITTLEGVVHAVDQVTGDATPALDLTSVVSTGGERGLLGAAVDPAGERLYLNYTNVDGDTEVRSWSLDDGMPTGAAADGVLHLRIGQPYPNHNGGHLVFGPDGALWIGTGDGGAGGDPGNVAQDPDSLLGKMLRVVPLSDGGVEAPTTNPDWGGRTEVWAIGLRNPWRYSFDRATNRLWIGDVGQEQVEEITVLDPDLDRPNLGWDRVEGDQPYEGEIEERFVAPVVTYGHDDGCSVAGGYVYRGDAVPALEGWYLFGDYCQPWIKAVPADAPSQPPTTVFEDAGQVVAFAELEDGELLVLSTVGVSRIVAG